MPLSKYEYHPSSPATAVGGLFGTVRISDLQSAQDQINVLAHEFGALRRHILHLNNMITDLRGEHIRLCRACSKPIVAEAGLK